MAFPTNSKGAQTSLSEINIVPLVDIMLVLLIIFMVTAPFLQEGIDVDLPEAVASSTPSEAKDKILTMGQAGEIFYRVIKKPIFETVGPQLANAFEGTGNKTIYLKADQSIPYGSVVKLMSLCKSVGIERIGMITQPDNISSTP